MSKKSIYTLDELSDLFDLPKWNEIEEINIDYSADAYSYGYNEAKDEGLNDEEAEEKGMEAERKVMAELFNRHCNSITNVVDEIAFNHNLELKMIKECYLYQFKPLEGKTWKDAAQEVVNTINGVGIFYYSSVKEFINSIPTTSYRIAVLSHLHYLKDYSEVYYNKSARTIYDENFR